MNRQTRRAQQDDHLLSDVEGSLQQGDSFIILVTGLKKRSQVVECRCYLLQILRTGVVGLMCKRRPSRTQINSAFATL